MQLSSLSLQSPLSSQASDSFIFPTAAAAGDQVSIAPSVSSVVDTDSATDLTTSTTSIATAGPRGRSLRAAGSTQPSGLSLMLAQRGHPEVSPSSIDSLTTPTAERPYPTPLQVVATDTSRQHAPAQASERTPLLDVEAAQSTQFYVSPGENGHSPQPLSKRYFKGAIPRWKAYSPAAALGGAFTSGLRALPAVILGTLLNILDGISCT
jgi:sulfate permease, SulP family